MNQDLVFKALADSNRRAIFDKLAGSRKNASELREGLGISQPAMSQHLGVLKAAGLVREERHGRFVHYEIDPGGIAFIGQWLAKYRAYWPERVADLQQLLKEMDQ